MKKAKRRELIRKKDGARRGEEEIEGKVILDGFGGDSLSGKIYFIGN